MLDFDGIFGTNKETVHTPRTYRIEGREVREEKLLSEGAFGFIWRAIDVSTKEVFALKRVICSGKERVQLAKSELQTMGKLKKSLHLVKFHGGSIEKENDNPMIVMLMELCPNGTLFDLLASKQESGFTQSQLLKILEEVLLGIKAVHESGYIHRDIKIQNVLVGTDGHYKLCDFGSCTDKEVDFAQIPKASYSDYEDQFESNTTPMYRPPEMVDPFKKFKVGKQVDVWMLGCVLYTLRYSAHPFVDANKAGIANGSYRFPESDQSEKINDLIRIMLTVDPQHRASVDQLLEIVKNWGKYVQIPMNNQATRVKEENLKKEKELSVYHKNTVEYTDDIPMEVLLKLQNQIKLKQEQPVTTFRAQNQPKTTVKNSISNPQPVAKVQHTKSMEDPFDSFSFGTQSKQTHTQPLKKNQPNYTIKKTQSLQFDLFLQSSQSQTVQSNQASSKNLTPEAEFYEFFRADSFKKEVTQKPQSSQIDFL